MKGLSIDYIFYAVIFVAVILVGFQIIKKASKQPEVKDIKYNLTYFCLSYNESSISREDLSDIIYAFLKEQCNDFYAVLTERVTIKDFERMAKEIKNVEIFEIGDCTFPPVNTGSVYLNFKILEKGDEILIKRRNVREGDVLICKIV